MNDQTMLSHDPAPSPPMPTLARPSASAPGTPPGPPITQSAPTRRLAPTALPTISALAIVLFPIRAFLGLGWLRAAVEKLIDRNWWSGGELAGFVADQHDEALPFMVPVIDRVVVPLLQPISWTVMVLQFAIAFGFLTTRFLRPALWAGISLNLLFVLLGAVNPSVFYLAIEISLLAAVNMGLLGSAPRPANAFSVGAKLGIGLAVLPYITTVHPHDVIEDPAIILATVAFLAAATEALRWLPAPTWPAPTLDSSADASAAHSTIR